MRVFLAAFALLALASCGAPTTSVVETSNTIHSVTSSETGAAAIELRDPWIAPTPNGATVAAGYMVIANNSAQADRLIGVSTARAQLSEVHRMDMENGMMRMRSAGPLEIPAGGTVTLASGGLHLMFTGVTRPFAEGETIPVTLRFERAGDVEADIPVRRSASH